jgi:hypothetical protein
VIQSGDTVFGFDEEVCESLFGLLDADGSGSLTVEEIMHSGEDPQIAKYVRSSNQPILESLVCQDSKSGSSGIGSGGNGSNGSGSGRNSGGNESRSDRLRSERLKRAFMTIVDQDGDGMVTREEWGKFIHQLFNERILYLKQYALINRIAYCGKGMTAGEPFMDPCGLVTRRWLLRGYIYFSYLMDFHLLFMPFFGNVFLCCYIFYQYSRPHLNTVTTTTTTPDGARTLSTTARTTTPCSSSSSPTPRTLSRLTSAAWTLSLPAPSLCWEQLCSRFTEASPQRWFPPAFRVGVNSL